jgi:hypothetical protein
MRNLCLAALACCQLMVTGCAPILTAAAAHATAIAAAADVAPLVLFAGAVGTLGVMGGAGNESETHEPGTFGAALRNAQTETDLLIQKATKDGQEALVEAGLQVDRAISRARVAYRENLGQKDALLGMPERTFETDIRQVIATLAAGERQPAKEAGDRARQMADKLRFPDGAPQVRSFGPQYLFSFLPFQSVSVRGTFPATYRKGELPQLTVNGRTYPAYTYSTESIDFSVPTRSLISVDQAQAISWSKAELIVPWDRPLFDPLTRTGYANFVMIGLLPDSLGRATFESSQSTVRVEERVRVSVDFEFDPAPGRAKQAGCLELSPREVSDGWKIIPGSGIVELPAPGRSSLEPDLQTQNERSICAGVRDSEAAATEPAAPGESQGRAAWRIAAKIRRSVTETQTFSESFDLMWNANRSFAQASGDWKVRYSIFNRDAVEVIGADASNPFVHVVSDARSVTIRTYPF